MSTMRIVVAVVACLAVSGNAKGNVHKRFGDLAREISHRGEVVDPSHGKDSLRELIHYIYDEKNQNYDYEYEYTYDYDYTYDYTYHYTYDTPPKKTEQQPTLPEPNIPEEAQTMEALPNVQEETKQVDEETEEMKPSAAFASLLGTLSQEPISASSASQADMESAPIKQGDFN
mmetsp:Transcript_155932/g.283611  ORF Transcript_155932/g.283611 Transcript_155932/m.283611 type:complete len:173 (+) Transcript_155932:81-599(+)